MTDGSTAPAPGTAPADPLVGKVIGERYRVCARLSQGGMGVVYRAEHVLLKSEFALKVLRRPQDPKSQKRFLKEAQIASRIKHPNIVFISDFGITPDGYSYLVMELLQGRTLKAELKGGRLSPLRACRIAIQIARGMHAAHLHNIVHRDLKPDNILLVSQEGSADFVKIIDFGIAKHAPETALSADATALMHQDASAASSTPGALTQAGAIIGTPAYMAPEQALSRPVDLRADQYALGCILYHMLTGSVPFSGDTPLAVLAMHMQDRAVPPRQRTPEAAVPEGLEAVVMQLLEKEPRARFASMQEVVLRLQRELGQLDPSSGQAGAEPGTRERVGTAAEPSTRLYGVQPSLRSVFLGRWWLAPAGGVGLVLSIALAAVVGGRSCGRASAPAALSVVEVRDLSQRAARILVEYSQRGDLTQRIGAVRALPTARNSEARDALLAQLDVPELDLRLRTIESLGQLGDRDVVPVLKSLLAQDDEEQVRLATAQSLMLLGIEEGESFLQQALTAGPDEARLRAALALCERHHQPAIDLLDRLLAQGRLRLDATLPVLYCLARSGRDRARQLLSDRMRTATALPEQFQAGLHLVRLGDADGRSFLLRLSQQPGPMRLVAARELAAVGEPIASDVFRYVISDAQADAAARITAISGMAWAGTPGDMRLLQPLLSAQTPPSLRLAAAAGLLELAAKDPRIMAVQSALWARRAVADPDWQVRQAGAAVLRDSSWSEATEALAGLLKDDQEQVRISSARSLGRRGERRALDALVQGLDDAKSAVRQEALSSLLRRLPQLRDSPSVAQAATKRVTSLLPALAPEEEVQARILLSRMGDSSQKARLQQLKESAPPSARRLLVEWSAGDVEFSARFLGDPAWKVRFAAACQLAERGDRRSLAVLGEALRQGGPDSVRAYGLLVRLGEKLAEPPELAGLITVSLVEQRMAAIEAVAALVPSRAASLLERAARDPEPLVRRLVAEVAAEVAAGREGAACLVVLRRLASDTDAAVRARAEVLIARLSQLPETLTLPPVAPRPAPHPLLVGEARAAQEAPVSRAAGAAVVTAPPGVWFQIDGRSWLSTPVPAITLSAGSHRLASFSREQTFQVESGRAVTLHLQESEIEKHANLGAAALRRREYRTALKNLEKAHALCLNNRVLAKPCVPLGTEVAYHMAAVYEALERWPEAMTWYEKLSQPAVRLSVERRGVVQQAMARLAPRLGKIIMIRKQSGRCQETAVWMPPGQHVLQINQRAESITVRPRSTTRIGSCP